MIHFDEQIFQMDWFNHQQTLGVRNISAQPLERGQVKAIVVTGKGAMFCGGAEITEHLGTLEGGKF